MSIEQFEISLGSRIDQVPARQNLKAMRYQEAKRKALEASKYHEETKKVNAVAVQEELHAEYNSEEPAKFVPEVLPAQDSEGTKETELYIEEILDLSEDSEDIVLVHKSTVLELDDDNFEIQEIREIQEENT